LKKKIAIPKLAQTLCNDVGQETGTGSRSLADPTILKGTERGEEIEREDKIEAECNHDLLEDGEDVISAISYGDAGSLGSSQWTNNLDTADDNATLDQQMFEHETN
jgi:hypothetical protein